MPVIAVFPGTFDPITYGHLDIVSRGAKLFDKLILAIAGNQGKNPRFSLTERVRLAEENCADFKNVTVCGFNGLLVDFIRENSAGVILRGVRTVSDFEYEFQLASMNKHLAPEVESLFLAPAEEHAFLSSSLVREVSDMGGDITSFVPANVMAALEVAKTK